MLIYTLPIFTMDSEFRIKYKHASDYVNVTFTMTQIGTGWGWTGTDEPTGNVIVSQYFNDVKTLTANYPEFGYDAPKSPVEPPPEIPWALIKIVVEPPTGFSPTTFYIDFRDEGWIKNVTSADPIK